jgi:hypothetical protein
MSQEQVQLHLTLRSNYVQTRDPGFTTINNTEMFKLKKNRDINLKIWYNIVVINYNTISKLYYSYKVRINIFTAV